MTNANNRFGSIMRTVVLMGLGGILLYGTQQIYPRMKGAFRTPQDATAKQIETLEKRVASLEANGRLQSDSATEKPVAKTVSPKPTIANGYSMEEVRSALGEPSQKMVTSESEMWLYNSSKSGHGIVYVSFTSGAVANWAMIRSE